MTLSFIPMKRTSPSPRLLLLVCCDINSKAIDFFQFSFLLNSLNWKIICYAVFSFSLLKHRYYYFLCRLGAHYRTSSSTGYEQDFDVDKLIVHPSYGSPLRYSHDIAIVKLSRPAVLNKYGLIQIYINLNLRCVHYSKTIIQEIALQQ